MRGNHRPLFEGVVVGSRVHAIFMQCTCTISRFRECKGSLHDKRVPVPGTGTRLPCKDSLRSLNLEIVQVHCLNIA